MTHTRTLRVQLLPQQYEKFRRDAIAAGMTLSDYIRLIIGLPPAPMGAKAHQKVTPRTSRSPRTQSPPKQ